MTRPTDSTTSERSSRFCQLWADKAERLQSADLTLGSSEGITADLDKAWHGIHYGA